MRRICEDVDEPLELEEGPRDRMLAFTYWERALRDGQPEERLNRAQNPPDWPVRRVTNALQRSLEDWRFDVRLAAMTSLERLGAVGQPAICGALTSAGTPAWPLPTRWRGWVIRTPLSR